MAKAYWVAFADVCDGLGVLAECHSTFDLSVILTYVYRPVPEPSAALLLLSALGIWIATRRRANG